MPWKFNPTTYYGTTQNTAANLPQQTQIYCSPHSQEGHCSRAPILECFDGNVTASTLQRGNISPPVLCTSCSAAGRTMAAEKFTLLSPLTHTHVCPAHNSGWLALPCSHNPIHPTGPCACVPHSTLLHPFRISQDVTRRRHASANRYLSLETVAVAALQCSAQGF